MTLSFSRLLLSLTTGTLLFACSNDKKNNTTNTNTETTSETSSAPVVDETPEEQEPNNSLAKASPITLGKAIRGSLGEVVNKKGDEDIFVLPSLSSKKRVRVTLSALPEIDLAVGLVGENGERLLVVNNKGVNEEEVIPAYVLPTGKVYVTVREAEKKGKPPASNETASYTLLVEELPDATPGEEVEPNDKRVDAIPIVLGQESKGFHAWKGDVDWYKIDMASVEAGSLLRIDFKGVAGTAPSIQLLDSIEDKLLEITPVKPEQPLTRRNIAVKSGAGFESYYLVVTSKKGTNAAEPYTLVASFEKGTGDTELEPNDDRKKATPIANAQVISGTLSQNDVDYYQITADAPAILRAELEGVEGINFVLELQDEDGNKLASVNEGAKKEGEVFTNIAVPMGLSYLKVLGGKGEFNDSTNYTLGVQLSQQDGTAEREPNPNRSKATPVSLGSAISGYLYPKNDVDAFNLDLSDRSEPTSLQIRLRGIPKVDLDMKLLDASDTEVQKAAAKPAGDDEILRVTLDPGNYLLLVTGAKKGANPRDAYTLEIEER